MNTTVVGEAELCGNYTESWVNIFVEPRKTVNHVEGFVMVAAVFMIALAILSPRRRQSRSIIVRYGVGGVFILSFPLLSYTVGLMQAGKIKNELYPVWAMFLAMLFGGTSSMSVHSLDQNKQLMKLYCNYALFSFCVGTVLASFGMVHSFSRLVPFIGCLNVVVYLVGIKSAEQWGAAFLAKEPSSENGIEWLALYMKREHQRSTSYDPRTMQGYKYPVLVHGRRKATTIGESAVTTLENIWCDNIGVLSSYHRAPIRRLKDLCLSFALFHLVVRRYFGYSCPESRLDKTRDLVLDGLLLTEQDYERAFQVIEAELAFLYDFFFTKYAYIMYGREVWYCVLSLTLTSVSIAAGAWSLSVLNQHGSMLDSLFVETSTQDVLVTLIALVALSVSQLLQIWTYCVSDWAKISLVCKYVAHPSWQGNDHIERLLLYFGRPHKWLRYWRNTIGQFSVLDYSFSCSYWDRLKHQLIPGGKAGKPVELPMQVKRAVARAIKNSTNGHLSHGTSALRHGMGHELGGACWIDDEYTLTDCILVWHVATSFCEISDAIKRPHDVHPNKIVAATLSKYCTYLVDFAPTLLPGSAPEMKYALDEMVKKAKETLHGLVSPREKYEKLSELQYEVGGERNLFTYGVVLGKTLESIDNHARRWDLLADFWAEMMVYTAPSSNVAGHIELLAEGGEFVTHVWALLMHAGILDRPSTGTGVP